MSRNSHEPDVMINTNFKRVPRKPLQESPGALNLKVLKDLKKLKPYKNVLKYRNHAECLLEFCSWIIPTVIQNPAENNLLMVVLKMRVECHAFALATVFKRCQDHPLAKMHLTLSITGSFQFHSRWENT